MVSPFFPIPRLYGCFYSFKRTTKTAVVGLVERRERVLKPSICLAFDLKTVVESQRGNGENRRFSPLLTAWGKRWCFFAAELSLVFHGLEGC